MMMYYFGGNEYTEDDIWDMMIDCGADDDFWTWVSDNYTIEDIHIRVQKVYKWYQDNWSQYIYEEIYPEYVCYVLNNEDIYKQYDIEMKEVIEDEE